MTAARKHCPDPALGFTFTYFAPRSPLPRWRGDLKEYAAKHCEQTRPTEVVRCETLDDMRQWIESHTVEGRKGDAGYIVAGVCEGSRTDVTSPAAFALLDYDGADIDWTEAKQYAGFAWTTASHTEAHPAWRLVVPFKAPVAHGKLRCPFDAGHIRVQHQPAFLPTRTEGAPPVEWRTLAGAKRLDAAALAPNRAERRARRTTSPTPRPVPAGAFPFDAPPDLSAIGEHVPPPGVDGDRHMLVRGLGGWLGRRGYAPEAIAEAVRLHIPSSNPGERAEQARDAAERVRADLDAPGWEALSSWTERYARGQATLRRLERACRDPREPEGFGDVWSEWWAGYWPRFEARFALLRAANDTDPGALLECVSWSDIMAPMPETAWLCERLGIAAAGRPNLLTAPAGAGKTMSAQALALAVASGGKLFGEFDCKLGPVLHIDLDQGQRATQHRYQMLAQGMRLKRSDAIDLQCSFFGLSLTRSDQIDANAVERLARTVRGKALVVVDSLRALAPGIDENASEFGAVLGALTGISNDTGVTWLVIHHSGKGEGTAVRGSSAIRDRAGCIWTLTRDTDTLVWHQDKISEQAIDPAKRFATTLETTPGLGLALRLAPDDSGAKASGAPRIEERRMIAEIVSPRRDGIAGREIVMALDGVMGRNRCRDVLDVMIADGDLVRDGKGPASRIHATERAREMTEQA